MSGVFIKLYDPDRSVMAEFGVQITEEGLRFYPNVQPTKQVMHELLSACLISHVEIELMGAPEEPPAPWPERQRRLVQAALALRESMAIGLVATEGRRVAMASESTVEKMIEFDAACAALDEEKPS